MHERHGTEHWMYYVVSNQPLWNPMHGTPMHSPSKQRKQTGRHVD